MGFSEIKKNKWFRFITSKYLLILVFFIVWMIFFDTNSFFIHHELNQDIKALEDSREFYKNEIKNDKDFIEKMEDSSEMEKFAREKYYLKKENEEIFIIEHQDSISKTKDNE